MPRCIPFRCRGISAKRFAARPIRRIPLAAGLFAQAAVSAVAARKRREIALPRKAGTQRALHKNFRFDLLADGGDLRKRRFPREDDARKPARFCLPRAVRVAYTRLRRKVQHHLRALPFELLSEEQLLHDQRVGARVPRLFRALEKGGELPLFDERVERHIHAHTEQMRAADELFEPFRRKIGGVCARGKTAHAEVYGIRPRIQRGKKRRFVARRRKDLTHDTIVPPFAAFEKGFAVKNISRKKVSCIKKPLRKDSRGAARRARQIFSLNGKNYDPKTRKNIFGQSPKLFAEPAYETGAGGKRKDKGTDQTVRACGQRFAAKHMVRTTGVEPARSPTGS